MSKKEERASREQRTLADGEATGHAHVLERTSAVTTEWGGREFINDEADVLVHEEHGPITVPSGKWSSGRALEYNNLEKMMKEVKD